MLHSETRRPKRASFNAVQGLYLHNKGKPPKQSKFQTPTAQVCCCPNSSPPARGAGCTHNPLEHGALLAAALLWLCIAAVSGSRLRIVALLFLELQFDTGVLITNLFVNNLCFPGGHICGSWFLYRRFSGCSSCSASCSKLLIFVPYPC